MATQGAKTKVLLAIDASPQAEEAFDWYFEHLYKTNDEVVVAHCPGQPQLPTMAFDTGIAVSSGDWDRVVQEHKAYIEQIQEKYENKLKALKVPYKLHFKMQLAGAGDAVCKLATEEGVDLIFIGSRGMGAIRRTILGSVSDYVVHHAHVPVTVHHSSKKH